MLYWLTHWLFSYHSYFRVFQYLSFRTIICVLTGMAIVLFLSPAFIKALAKRQIRQAIRTDGPQSHFSKSGTPTMGGVLILIGIVISILLWADLTNIYIWLLLFVLISYGVIGWVDDYRKVIQRNSKGLPARWKFFWQSVVAILVTTFLYFKAVSPAETQLIIPFIKNYLPNLGLWYLLLAYFVIVGASNAVNLTDGLDGLAIMPVILVAAALGVCAYVAGNKIFTDYLAIPYIPDMGELVVFCASMVGACLGFLWYNAYPAQVFMGDVGALALGGALGLIAVMVRQELILLVMGGIFVIETVSVILQVASFKLTGKRIFKMAPLHHHFELKGWPEPKIIVRFWIITVVLVLIGLATLKLR